MPRVSLPPITRPAPIASPRRRALLALDDDAIVVNVQGDEPLLSPALIRAVAELLAAHPEAAIATACHPITDSAEAFNPNVVKVVLDHERYALYFSRATIPWARDTFAGGATDLPPGLPLYRHYGLYAYRVRFLRVFPTLAPAPIERFEALEQLRALWHGFRIVVEITTGTPAPGVDTPDDLERVRALYAAAKPLNAAQLTEAPNCGQNRRALPGRGVAAGRGPASLHPRIVTRCLICTTMRLHATDSSRPARRRQRHPGHLHRPGALDPASLDG